ncbi:hypothetical protein EWM64_g8467 [Hericium alpestre]|uniref:Synaptobrevin homolog YKT6 n=1 Tax=Hericium alpestre TaxID=135208 RepID=A0A4Y9ZLQ2_9AGAM|nr:hypothetical protein EWM64_g8467 [Hericium alpestre]
MTVQNATAPSENCDDDFLSQQGPSSSSHAKQRVADAVNGRCSTSSSADLGSDAPSRHHKPTPHAADMSGVTPAHLQEWADPGPSTPPKRSVAQAENWDDDFEDKVDSPASPSRRQARRGEYTRQQQAASLPQVEQEPENWDDDFELDKANSPPRGESWSSDEEDDGPALGDEEDRTVTARSRRTAVPQPSPPPPVPPLPTSFPGSPSLSVFSIPSGRDSVAYSSAAHLPLRAGSNSALAMLPPSPPIHKERRRLRKKSRPPEDNVFELLDRSRDERPPPPAPPPQDSPPQPASPDQSMSTKTPLLSRIGSVKKWGARKKRASTGPAEVLLNELDGNKDATPRPASRTSDAQHQSQTGSPSSKHSSWFFRNSGGGGGGAASSGSSPSAVLAHGTDLSSFSFYQKGSVAEFLTFFTKTVAERTPQGQRQSVQENNYTAHVYNRGGAEQLAAVIITDQEYPVRPAFSLLTKVLDDFTAKVPQSAFATPAAINFPEVNVYVQKYQDPRQADAIMRVQQELDETKVVLHKTIESVLQRGEKLDNLVERSEALSAQSKMFYKTAKKSDEQNATRPLCDKEQIYERDARTQAHIHTRAINLSVY